MSSSTTSSPTGIRTRTAYGFWPGSPMWTRGRRVYSKRISWTRQRSSNRKSCARSARRGQGGGRHSGRRLSWRRSRARRQFLLHVPSTDLDWLLHFGGRIHAAASRRDHSRPFRRLHSLRSSDAVQEFLTMAATKFDAIVVGSGMTGGWAAKELTEKGLHTLVLEAGRPIVPEKDYVEHVAPWEMPFRGMRDRKKLLQDQPIQSLCYACEETNAQFFVKDTEHPYTTEPGKPFRWIRGRQVGGRSILWGRQSYRWSDLDFTANLREGIAVDWPIRYADLAPWYDYVEDFIGISGEALGLAQLPDGKFLPPMAMNCAELAVKQAMAKHFGGERVLTIGRVAVLTEAHRGRAACHYCGPCHRGCITLSYFSSVNATLPAAEKTGRLTLRPFSTVDSLIFDSNTRRISGVRVIDSQTKAALE